VATRAAALITAAGQRPGPRAAAVRRTVRAIRGNARTRVTTPHLVCAARVTARTARAAPAWRHHRPRRPMTVAPRDPTRSDGAGIGYRKLGKRIERLVLDPLAVADVRRPGDAAGDLRAGCGCG
jgi:hypothetical protein